MSAYVLSNGQRVYPAFLLNSESGGGIVTPPASFRLADGTHVTGIVLVDDAGDIVPSPGGQQPDNYIDVVDGMFTNSLSESSHIPAQNTAYLHRFRVARTFDLDKIGVYIGSVAAGNIDAGVYTSDGTTWTRIASNGGVAVGSVSAVQEIAMSATVTLDPGTDYWLALAVDGATTYILHTTHPFTNFSGHGNRVISKTTSYPLPATITTPSKATWVPAALLIT